MKELFKDTRKLTFLGVMLALSIVFCMATMLPTAGTSMAIIMFLPTILTGIIQGPKAGWLMGTAVGIVILIRALVLPMSILDPLFVNPLLSVVPRMFIGIVAAYVYKLIVRNSKSTGRVALGSALAGAAGMITNTILVMSAMYFIYAERIADALGMAFKAFLIATLSSSAIIEAVVGAILTSAIVTAYTKLRRN